MNTYTKFHCIQPEFPYRKKPCGPYARRICDSWLLPHCLCSAVIRTIIGLRRTCAYYALASKRRNARCIYLPLICVIANFHVNYSFSSCQNIHHRKFFFYPGDRRPGHKALTANRLWSARSVYLAALLKIRFSDYINSYYYYHTTNRKRIVKSSSQLNRSVSMTKTVCICL